MLALIASIIFIDVRIKAKLKIPKLVLSFVLFCINDLFWIFLQPLLTIYLSIFDCVKDDNGISVHFIDQRLVCYSTIHIIVCIIVLVFFILFCALGLIKTLYFCEYHINQDNALARIHIMSDYILYVAKLCISIQQALIGEKQVFVSWIIVFCYLLLGIFLNLENYKYVPFYQEEISKIWNISVGIFLWISLNAVLVKIVQTVNGHIIVILLGCPLIYLLQVRLRENRLSHLMNTDTVLLKNQIDALIQISTLTEIFYSIENSDRSAEKKIQLIGFINQHASECQNQECPCHIERDLYDISTSSFSQRNQDYHLDEIFLKHFIKRLYETALEKFPNSIDIHIAFSFYLLNSMDNYHVALSELTVVSKKRATHRQQFTVLRQMNVIEKTLISNDKQLNDNMNNLKNVIMFENIFEHLNKLISKACNLHLQFWTSLQSFQPDFNIINKINDDIYYEHREVKACWLRLCEINPNYTPALRLYGEYLDKIMKDSQQGMNFIDKATYDNTSQKSGNEIMQKENILFSERTAVIHISGNKESLGKILKVNQGVIKVFGFQRQEVVGNSVNMLMPTLFSQKHDEFLRFFYETGYSRIFNRKRTLFATKRSGHAFSMKILIKQIPAIDQGIQYVGLIRQLPTDNCEYILTDTEGYIDSFTQGISNMLDIQPQIIKDHELNIQILIPQLYDYFHLERLNKKNQLRQKYLRSKGINTNIFIPFQFQMILKEYQGKAKGQKKKITPVFRKFLSYLFSHKMRRESVMNPRKRPTFEIKDLIKSKEYLNAEKNFLVNVEINELKISLGKKQTSNDVQLKVFKIQKLGQAKQNFQSSMNNVDESVRVLDIHSFLNKEQHADHRSVDFFRAGTMTIGDENSTHKMSEDLRSLVSNDKASNINNFIHGTQYIHGQMKSPQITSFTKTELLNMRHGIIYEVPGEEESKAKVESLQLNNFTNAVNSPKRLNLINEPVIEEDEDQYISIKGNNLNSDKEVQSSAKLRQEIEQADEIIEEEDQSEESEESINSPKSQGQEQENSDGEQSTKKTEQMDQNFVLANENLRQQVQKNHDIDLINSISKNESSSYIQDELFKKVEASKQNNIINLEGDNDVDLESLSQLEDFVDDQQSIKQDAFSLSKSGNISFKLQKRSPGKLLNKRMSSSVSGKDQFRSNSIQNSQADNKSQIVNETGQIGALSQSQNESLGKSNQTKAQDSSSNNGGFVIKISPFERDDQLYNRHLISQQETQTNLQQPDLGVKPNVNNYMWPNNQSSGNSSPKNNHRLSKRASFNIKNQQKQQSKKFSFIFVDLKDRSRIVTNKKYYTYEDEIVDQNMTHPTYYSIDNTDEDNIYATLIKQKQKEERRRIEFERRKKMINDKQAAKEKELEERSDDDQSTERPMIYQAQTSQIEKVNYNYYHFQEEPKPENNSSSSSSHANIRNNRFIQNLKNAIQEENLPRALSNFKILSKFLFFFILTTAVILFVYQIDFNKTLNNKFYELKYYSQRSLAIDDVNLQALKIVHNFGEKPELSQKLINYSKEILQHEYLIYDTFLESYNKELKERYHRVRIEFEYYTNDHTPMVMKIGLIQSLLNIVTYANILSQQILDSTLSKEIRETINIILSNNFNQIVPYLEDFDDLVGQDILDTIGDIMSLLLIFLMIATAALTLIVIFVLPALNVVKKTKKELLKLLMLRKLQEYIVDEVELIRRFMVTQIVGDEYQDSDDSDENNMEGGPQEQQDQEIKEVDSQEKNSPTKKQRKWLGEDNSDEEDDQEIDSDSDSNQFSTHRSDSLLVNRSGKRDTANQLKDKRHQKKKQKEAHSKKHQHRTRTKHIKRRWKNLKTSIFKDLIKFLGLMLLIEGYFLFQYMISIYFLQDMRLILAQINNQYQTTHHAEMLYISTLYCLENQDRKIAGVQCEEYLMNLLDDQIHQHQELMLEYKENFKKFSPETQAVLSHFMDQDSCELFDQEEKQQCSSFQAGILTKGFYTGKIKYLSIERQIILELIKERSVSNRQQIDNQTFSDLEQFSAKYFRKFNDIFSDAMQNEAQLQFEYSNMILKLVFSIFIIYIVILFFYLLRREMKKQEEELWRSKFILNIMPPIACFKIQEIRMFIMRNSKTMLLADKLFEQ